MWAIHQLSEHEEFIETDGISDFASWFWNNAVFGLYLQNASPTMRKKENEHVPLV